jgi:hypothetical protein
MGTNATSEIWLYQKVARFACTALNIENDIDTFLEPYLQVSAEVLPRIANWVYRTNNFFWEHLNGPFLHYLVAWILINLFWLKVPSLLQRYWPHDLPELEAEPLIPYPRRDDCIFRTTMIHEVKRIHRGIVRIQEDIAIANVTRKVHVTRGSRNQGSDVVIHIETGAARLEDCNRIRAYDLRRDNSVVVTAGPQHWSRGQPRDQQPDFSGSGGYAIITLYIRPGARFFNLIINTMRAAIELGENTTFDADAISLHSVDGDIACARAYDFATYSHVNTGRVGVAVEASSNIIGEWALARNVSMAAHAGNINVDLKPWRYAAAIDPICTIHLRSFSGDIEARIPILPGTLAFKQYRTTVETQRGNIRGVLPHNRETLLTSEHGSIDATLLPFNTCAGKYISKLLSENILRTKSLHGDTRVRILESAENLHLEHPTQTHSRRPEAYCNLAMDRTKCRYQTGLRSPGSLWLEYPEEWDGYLKGRSLNGSIHVNGSFHKLYWRSSENDERIEDGRKKVYALRGVASNTTKFRVGTGDAHVTVGQVGESISGD